MSGILQYKVPSLVQSSLQNAPFRSKPEKDISEYTSKQSRLTSHMNFCVQIDNHFIVFPWTIVWLFIIFYDLRTYFSSFVQLKNDYYMRKIISNDILQFKEELCHYSILSYPFFVFLNIIYLLFLILFAIGLYCWAQTFSSSGAQAFHCCGSACHGAQVLGADSSVEQLHAWVQLFLGMWNLPRPGIELLSPSLVGRVLTTGTLGHFFHFLFKYRIL